MTRFLCILSGLALFAISLIGSKISISMSSDYFSNAIDIPDSGLIGVVVAGSLIVLGFVSPLLTAQGLKYLAGAAWLLLFVISLVDGFSNVEAQKSKVLAVEQEIADRNNAYNAAKSVKADADSVIEDYEAKVSILEGSDVYAAQKLLGVIQDGVWGDKTTLIAQRRKDYYLEEIATAKIDLRNANDVLAKGVAVSGPAFTEGHAQLYGIGLTIIGLVLSIFGGVLCTIKNPQEEKALQELPKKIGNVLAMANRINEKFGNAA